MSSLLSTTATYFASTWWPRSQTNITQKGSTKYSTNMTFWNDLLSAITQLSLFSSSTVATSAITTTTPIATTTATELSSSTLGAATSITTTANESMATTNDPLNFFTFNDTMSRNASEFKMLNDSVVNEIVGNLSSDSVFSGGIDCHDFTEDKLLNLWNCTLLQSNVNSVNSNSSDYFYLDNSNFNNTILNISDDIIKLYYYNGSNLNNDTVVSSGNSTGIKSNIESTIYFIEVVSTAVILGIIILATVIGNVFVIAAILLERNLQSVANYLILSLAVADLLVACLVMPLSAVYEISKEWKLGPELCDMWTSSDVLCCTASILHLVAIALDRYWAVTDIDYAHQRTAKRIGIMILILWTLSFFVSIAPMFGWKDPEWDLRLENYQCLVSQDISYQIFATASSFYVPLLVILFLYWRIFLTARKRIRRRQQVTYGQPNQGSTPMGGSAGGIAATGLAAAVVAVIGKPLPTISEATTTTTTTQFTNVSSTNTSPEKGSYGNGLDDRIEIDEPTADISMAYPSSVQSCPPTDTPTKCKKRFGGSKYSAGKLKPSILKKRTNNPNDTNSKRERKAAKTLAIITGAFVCCWLPFFIIAILLPACPECDISPIIISLCLWLGYFNSTLNPIIYTIFSPEFRHAFKRILCGRRNSIRRRNRRMGMRHTR